MLSDGWHHIRLDVIEGSLVAGSPVVLHYRFSGLGSAGMKLLPLKRFIDLCRTRRFSPSLYPREPRLARLITALRVHDALAAGATQREIGLALFGMDFADGAEHADSLRSRVRRLVVDARRLAAGGYRTLMRERR